MAPCGAVFLVMVCQAKQHSDQMCCGKCGQQWDVNDSEPPKCQPKRAGYLQLIKRLFGITGGKK